VTTRAPQEGTSVNVSRLRGLGVAETVRCGGDRSVWWRRCRVSARSLSLRVEVCRLGHQSTFLDYREPAAPCGYTTPPPTRCGRVRQGVSETVPPCTCVASLPTMRHIWATPRPTSPSTSSIVSGVTPDVRCT